MQDLLCITSHQSAFDCHKVLSFHQQLEYRHEIKELRFFKTKNLQDFSGNSQSLLIVSILIVINNLYKVSHQNYYQANNPNKMLNKSAKVVKINLNNETKKYHTSNKAHRNKEEIINQKQFSFSDDKQKEKQSEHKLLPPSKGNVSKKSSPASPQKSNHNKKVKKKDISSKDKINEIRKKVQEYNENYEAVNERDLLFKKSIDNLKTTMFDGSRDNKKLTIKTLKEIGKYALNKSKQKQIYKYSPSRNQNTKVKKDIPVQFYGAQFQQNNIKTNSFVQFNQSHNLQNQPKYENGLSIEQLLKGTYTSFQQRYSDQIDSVKSPPHPIIWQRPNWTYNPKDLDPQAIKKIDQSSNYFQKDQEKPIEQNQIDVICQIFELCEKYEEGDRIVLKDFDRLMQQLERMFFIKVIQQSRVEKRLGISSQIPEQQHFYDTLKQFEKAFKIIFYRREANNIYDTMYYLKQSNKLRTVTINFAKIKLILPL